MGGGDKGKDATGESTVGRWGARKAFCATRSRMEDVMLEVGTDESGVGWKVRKERVGRATVDVTRSGARGSARSVRGRMRGIA